MFSFDVSEEDGDFADSTADLEQDLIVPLGGSIFFNMIAHGIAHSTADSEQAPCVPLRGPAFLMMLVFEFANSSAHFEFIVRCVVCGPDFP